MNLKNVTHDVENSSINVIYTMDDNRDRNLIFKYKRTPNYTYSFETTGEFLEDFIKLLGFSVLFPVGYFVLNDTDKKLENCREPSEEDINSLMKSANLSYYGARERLREESYGGKPPSGYSSWGDYWKGL